MVFLLLLRCDILLICYSMNTTRYMLLTIFYWLYATMIKIVTHYMLLKVCYSLHSIFIYLFINITLLYILLFHPYQLVRLGAPLEGAPPAIVALGLDFQTNTRLLRERVYSQLEELNKLIDDLQIQIPFEVSRTNSGINVDIGKTATPRLTEAKSRNFRKELAQLKRQRLWAEISVEKMRMVIRGTILNEG